MRHRLLRNRMAAVLPQSVRPRRSHMDMLPLLIKYQMMIITRRTVITLPILRHTLTLYQLESCRTLTREVKLSVS